MKPVQEEFSYQVPGQIWRALPCLSGCWAIEWRILEEKRVGFSVIDPLKPGAVAIEAAVDGIDWWSSLAGAGLYCFFIHSYRNTDIPEPTDLAAFDMSSGEMRWILPGYRFEGVSDRGMLLVARKDAGGISVFECEELTGRVLAASASHERPGADWQEAYRYTRGEAYYDFLRLYFHRSFGDLRRLCPGSRAPEPRIRHSYDLPLLDIDASAICPLDGIHRCTVSFGNSKNRLPLIYLVKHKKLAVLPFMPHRIGTVDTGILAP